MPCDQTITCRVDLHAADRAILKLALEREFRDVSVARDGTLLARAKNGVPFSISPDGQLEYETSRYGGAQERAAALGNAVNRAYTRATLSETVSKFDFLLEEDEDEEVDAAQGRRRFRLTKAIVLALAVLAGVARAAGAHPTIEQKRPCHDERPCVVAGAEHHETEGRK